MLVERHRRCGRIHVSRRARGRRRGGRGLEPYGGRRAIISEWRIYRGTIDGYFPPFVLAQGTRHIAFHHPRRSLHLGHRHVSHDDDCASARRRFVDERRVHVGAARPFYLHALFRFHDRPRANPCDVATGVLRHLQHERDPL